MKKFNIILLSAVLLLSSACTNQNLADMQSFETEQYVGITWENRNYVPYCAVKYSDKTNLLGYVDGDKKQQVYSYENYSTDEWIVNYSRYDNTFMLLREINVTEIPDGFVSEYEWNQ